MKTKYIIINDKQESFVFNHWLDMMSALATMVDSGQTVSVKRLDDNITNP